MDEKITALLNNNLRVIIPGFGAFIIRQQQPRIVVFNEELKNNDGLLTEYIMKTEGIEKDMAEQLLMDYINHARRLLESGDILWIEGIGELKQDKKGKVILTPKNEIKPVKKETIGEKKTGKPVQSKKPVARSKTRQVSKTVPLVKPAPAETEKATPTIVEKAGPALVTAQSPGFWSRPIVKWIFVFVLANILILAFFMLKDNFRPGSKKLQEPFTFTDSVLQQLADSVRVAAEDTALIFREEATVTPLDSNSHADGKLRYYIVAGCFKDEINADELVRSLDSLGYKAEKFGKIGDLYAVSFASFDDKELAAKELARIREKSRPDAWMTRF